MRVLLVSLLVFPLTVSCGGGGGGKSTADTGSAAPPSLNHITTWELDPGTHRPELAITDDGDLLVIVVEHVDSDEGRVSHMGYRFNDAFESVVDPFVVARDTDEYGHPADHRIALVDDTLVVVYQSLVDDPDAESTGGAAEATALNQSLMIAIFDANDGTELNRQPIAPNVTDFGTDNFPDHCLLWHEDRLLVSTGSRMSESTTPGATANAFRIREIDPALDWPDNVLTTHDLTASEDTLPSVIGNSFVHGPGGAIWMWGSTGPHQSAEIKAAPLGADFTPGASTGFVTSDREQTFPTGVLFDGDEFWVAHISRDRGGELGLESNPYTPRLMRISADLGTVISDEPMPSGLPGASHVHPHLARHGDRLYLAWSKQAEDHTPQVVIEVFEISGG